MGSLDEFEEKMDARFRFLVRLMLNPKLDADPTGVFTERESGMLLALGFTRHQGSDHPNRMVSKKHCLAIDKDASGGWKIVSEYDDMDVRKSSMDFIAILMYLADNNL